LTDARDDCVLISECVSARLVDHLLESRHLVRRTRCDATVSTPPNRVVDLEQRLEHFRVKPYLPRGGLKQRLTNRAGADPRSRNHLVAAGRAATNILGVEEQSGRRRRRRR
jgi:hypothetical protein